MFVAPLLATQDTATAAGPEIPEAHTSEISVAHLVPTRLAHGTALAEETTIRKYTPFAKCDVCKTFKDAEEREQDDDKSVPTTPDIFKKFSWKEGAIAAIECVPPTTQMST